MGTLTGIRSIINDSPNTVELEHHEDRDRLVVAAGGNSPYFHNVPWADNQAQFDQRRLDVRVVVPNQEDTVFGLWQRSVGGDDRIRFSETKETAQFADPGSLVAGSSEVGGNRVLQILGDNTIRLIRSG